MKIETGTPTTSGYFVVWLRLCDRPLVLWRSMKTNEWRNGCMKVEVDAWMGPLPERKAK